MLIMNANFRDLNFFWKISRCFFTEESKFETIVNLRIKIFHHKNNFFKKLNYLLSRSCGLSWFFIIPSTLEQSLPIIGL